MMIVGQYSRISCFLIVILLASLSSAQSQDIFHEMNQVKSDLSSLKSEVSEIKRLVYELRRAVLDQAMASGRQERRGGEAKDQMKEEKKPSPVDEEQITKIACRAVGHFFHEAESALKSNDPSMARTKMTKALRKLTSALHDYSTHRVSKLLTIYDGLAWSTYTAVQLSDSVTGNEDFLAQLRKHKQKYIETCPRE